MVPIQALPKNNSAYNPVKEYSDAWMASFNTTGDEFGRTLWDGVNLIRLAVKAKPDLTKVEESRQPFATASKACATMLASVARSICRPKTNLALKIKAVRCSKLRTASSS